MERGSSKVAPRLDDELKHDTDGIVKGGHDPRVEEWKGSEPPGEDQPRVGLRPEESTAEGPEDGMSAADVEQRSELASYIARADYPLERDAIVAILTGRNAPDRLVTMVAGLPDGETVDNLQDLWRRLGGTTE
ncbi:MAG TPA: hypothetical protein VHW74_02220 [Mycobacteriales bacterium]|jgi:hypothetical protein|nr:hypothetical protein [Mycobacteriales bacterium]